MSLLSSAGQYGAFGDIELPVYSESYARTSRGHWRQKIVTSIVFLIIGSAMVVTLSRGLSRRTETHDLETLATTAHAKDKFLDASLSKAFQIINKEQINTGAETSFPRPTTTNEEDEQEATRERMSNDGVNMEQAHTEAESSLPAPMATNEEEKEVISEQTSNDGDELEEELLPPPAFVRHHSTDADIPWYKAAVHQGDVGTYLKAAKLFEKGSTEQGVARNVVEAARWYREAADLGNLRAQLALGRMYETSLQEAAGASNNQHDKEGSGFVAGALAWRYNEVAAHWWLAAAEQGDAGAQTHLALLYATGKGVEQSDAEAAKWLQASAAPGDAAMVDEESEVKRTQ
jgi:hypothetical protein